MNFLAPLLLVGLLLVPALLALYVWAQRRRTRYAVRFTNLDLLANLAPRRPAWRRHVPPAIYLAAVTALSWASLDRRWWWQRPARTPLSC